MLVVNTNGGGHAPIGFHLCKHLLAGGHEPTILTVGAADDKKMQKPPFTYFDSELASRGVRCVWGEPSNLGAALPGAAFDVVVDNNGKDMDVVGPVIDFAKASGAKQFLFVSSCGVYKATDCPPHVEGDAVKETAGHVLVETALADSGLAWSSFRPQYLTGYGSNKDCEEWFFDRIVRGRPVPVPGSGDQLSNISHASDLGKMMALAVGNPAAVNQVFNCVNNKGVTLNGMVKLCAKVCGVADVKIVNYDPDDVPDLAVKKAFPFRPIHFYAQPVKAQSALGWEPEYSLEETLKARFVEYQASGRGSKPMDFPTDDAILAAVGQTANAW